jgi:hypothetical protein
MEKDKGKRAPMNNIGIFAALRQVEPIMEGAFFRPT